MHPLNSDYDHRFEYVLMIKNDLSGFVELVPRTSPHHFVAADALMAWYKRFGLLQYLFGDQGKHLRTNL